ncbi:MAG TPA: hypothetical protein VE524_06105 [Nitrososphaeraceae archaeon]|nr:hypothetical protein [Nitrososphaeraceae archaeon]
MAAPTQTITPPPDLWSHPIWIPLGVLVGLLAIVVPIGLYLIARKKRELSYLRLSDTSIVNINKEFTKEVKISYMGIESKTLQLIRFKIINTGNQPINPEDFKVPLTFFPDKKMRDGDITGLNVLTFPETSPKDLRPEVIYHNKRQGIRPLLLNPGDSITVELINIDEYDNKAILDVQGGISGVKIKEIKPKEINQFKLTDYLFISFLVGITLSIIVYLISTFTISNYLLSFPDSEFFFRYLLPIIALIISILLSLIIKYKNFFLEQAE